MTIWPSPAKLNLFLYITSRHPSGYHNLQTLFQFLNYGDELHIIPRSNGQVRLLTAVPGIENENNLIIRAAQLLMAVAKSQGILPIQSGVDIAINKRLPLGSGLGGGSSNAATVLIALNYLWNTKIKNETLCSLGFQLGSDIPVFIRGQASYSEGMGEILQPAFPPERWYLVVYPGIEISTKQIFNDPTLIRNTPMRSLEELLQTPFRNDCEIVVRKLFHEVDFLISWLLQFAPSRLTGTGSCVFAEFDTEFAAYQVLKKIPNWTQGFVAQGVNFSPLHRVLSRKKL